MSRRLLVLVAFVLSSQCVTSVSTVWTANLNLTCWNGPFDSLPSDLSGEALGCALFDESKGRFGWAGDGIILTIGKEYELIQLTRGNNSNVSTYTAPRWCIGTGSHVTGACTHAQTYT